jgi:hypothetical protein
VERARHLFVEEAPALSVASGWACSCGNSSARGAVPLRDGWPDRGSGATPPVSRRCLAYRLIVASDTRKARTATARRMPVAIRLDHPQSETLAGVAVMNQRRATASSASPSSTVARRRSESNEVIDTKPRGGLRGDGHAVNRHAHLGPYVARLLVQQRVQARYGRAVTGGDHLGQESIGLIPGEIPSSSEQE